MADTFNMTSEEFKIYSNEIEFRNLLVVDKFDHVWARIPHQQKADLIKYFKNKDMLESLASNLGKNIFKDYKEFGYVTVDSKFIISQIKFYSE